MLQTWLVPAELRKASKARIGAKAKKHRARRWHARAEDIIEALATQTVTVTGTNVAAIVIPYLAESLTGLYRQRADIEEQIEALVIGHLLHPVLTSMPGVGVRTAAVIIAELVGKEFASVTNLASYAGLTPRARQSGTSIKSETVSHTGTKRRKRALFLSAFASLRSDPVSCR